MDTGLASRIVKARQYAQERDRVDLTHLEAKFKGEHDTYQINYDNNQWRWRAWLPRSSSRCRC